jgi:prepilin-type N-terminal cleavage/methylation domain-containing protein
MRAGIRNLGFTLIELIVVVGIIGILSAIGIPMYNGYVTSAKARAATKYAAGYLFDGEKLLLIKLLLLRHPSRWGLCCQYQSVPAFFYRTK